MFNLTDIPYFNELQRELHGPFTDALVHKDCLSLKERQSHNNKIVASLEESIRLVGLKDGMTISFHHHFRNGDYVVNMVLDAVAKMGIRDLTLAASSLIDIHTPVIEHIKNGVIRRIETSGLRGELGDAISKGLMDVPVVFRSHGGRAAAIESGDVVIDVAFLGAPSCDPFGNANGYSRENDSSVVCGSMGYAKLDAQFARSVIIITDNIVPFPNVPFGIPATDVDYIVRVDAIGDPQGIMVGATRYTTNPKELLIAETAANVIEASGLFRNGFSMQMGSGGASLAVARFLHSRMVEKNIKASFALGGITGQIVTMHEQGLIKKILDVQSFDVDAAYSLKNNHMHQQISASYYASPLDDGSAVNQLDFAILSALEIDVDFNVNVILGSDGLIRGAIGGHQDTAAGAAISIITCPLTRGRLSTVVDKVECVVTPGRSVDIVVTDHGVAVNPRRPELRQKIVDAGIRTVELSDLRDTALKHVGTPLPISYTDKIVGVVTYRDGSVIDVIRQVADLGS